MKLRTANGTPVDPVPFLVVAGLTLLVGLTFGPSYCMALGLRLSAGVCVSAVACLGTIAVAYHRMVWTARPELRGEIPAAQRFLRLIYAAVIGGLLVVLLALPLVPILR